jgi:hypothetical protein
MSLVCLCKFNSWKNFVCANICLYCQTVAKKMFVIYGWYKKLTSGGEVNWVEKLFSFFKAYNMFNPD